MAKYVLLLLLMSGAICPAYAACASSTMESGAVQASWYGPGFHDKTMASGKRFSQNNAAIVAHPFLPLGSMVCITNIENGKSIYAWVMDRGPYRLDGKKVELDVSKAAAQKLGFIHQGLTRTTILLVWAPGLNLD